MTNHIVTKSRAIGTSHYRVEEVLPVNVLSKFPPSDRYLEMIQADTRTDFVLQNLVKELEELLFAEYDGMPNTPEKREALGSSVEEHLYNRLKGGKRD